MIVALTLVAGGVGAVARFVLDGTIRSRWPHDLPWATVVINVSGSLLLGVLTGLTLRHGLSDDVRLIAGTGFCGGYTTFSTACVETIRLGQRRRPGWALANTAGVAALAFGAAALGMLITR